MATIMPKKELLCQALKYISEKKSEKPNLSLSTIMDEAGMRFNLTPADARDLERFFKENPQEFCKK